MNNINISTQMIYIEDYRNFSELRSKYPNALCYSVMHNSRSELRKFSPYYKWGNITIPYTYNKMTESVDSAMKELGEEITNRDEVFISLYRWMLEDRVANIINKLRGINKYQDIVFLDYHTPLSYVYLIKAYVEGLSPYEDVQKTIYHYHAFMVGQREYVKVTEEKTYKPFPKDNINPQLQIKFYSKLC